MQENEIVAMLTRLLHSSQEVQHGLICKIQPNKPISLIVQRDECLSVRRFDVRQDLKHSNPCLGISAELFPEHWLDLDW